MSRESARSLRLRDEPSLDDPNGSKWTGLNLTNTIRDNQSVVPATGNHWAYNMKGIKDDLLEDPNTAYTRHVYAGHDENKPARWVQALDGPEEVRPVLVTEWGFEPRTNEHFRGTARTLGNEFRIQFLEERGVYRVVLEPVLRPGDAQARLESTHLMG